MTLNTGHVINNRYRIVKLLGQGGFGAVYKAWDLNLNRPCALKENLDTWTDAEHQFMREAQMLANLAHPNLPHVSDYFAVPGQGQYLVMELVEGEDLESLLQREGALTPDQALHWIGQIADALQYMHCQQPPVIHRDIKPANIRITPEGRAVLVDFGLAKTYAAHQKTTAGARAVTEGYSPPEQYGTGATDARTDIYALAATLYTLLTGQQPQESVQRIVDDQVKSVERLNARIKPQVGQAIACSMSLNPSYRYQTIHDFKQALTSDRSVVSGAPRPVFQKTTRMAGASMPRSHARQTHPALWLGLAVVLIAAVGAVGVAAGLIPLPTGAAAAEVTATATLAPSPTTPITAQLFSFAADQTPLFEKPDVNAKVQGFSPQATQFYLRARTADSQWLRLETPDGVTGWVQTANVAFAATDRNQLQQLPLVTILVTPTDTPTLQPTATLWPTATPPPSKTPTMPPAPTRTPAPVLTSTPTRPPTTPRPVQTNTPLAPIATVTAAVTEPLWYGFEFTFCTYDGGNYTCNIRVWGLGGSGSYYFAMENPDTGNWDQRGPASSATFIMRSRRCRMKIQQLRYWDTAGNHPADNPNITMAPDAIAALFPGGACTVP